MARGNRSRLWLSLVDGWRAWFQIEKFGYFFWSANFLRGARVRRNVKARDIDVALYIERPGAWIHISIFAGIRIEIVVPMAAATF